MLRIHNFNRRTFSIREKLLNFVGISSDKSNELATKDPKRFDSPFPTNYLKPQERTRQLSVLPNGVRIVSETPALPGPVTLGIMLEVGSRHENDETSGSLFSIKSTYYKSHMNTNEMINYGMVQMSGGKYDMEFNRENTVFKATCLSHDVSDIFAMMSDCVTEPRSAMAANVAISKMGHLRKINEVQNPGQNDTDAILSQIYGESGIGMPLLGRARNMLNLNSYTLQKFQIQNYSPNKIIIAGLGVINHGEFLNLTRRFFENLAMSDIAAQDKPVFREIDIKSVDKTATKNEVYLLFESVPSNHPDFVKANVLRELFGSADVSNPACQTKNNGLFIGELYNKDKSVYSVEAFNLNFKDAGLFGFRFTSGADNSNQVIESLAKLVKSVEKFSEEDLLVAKKRLTRKMIESNEDEYSRITELLNHYSVFGEFRLQEVLKEVESLTVKSLATFLKTTVSGKNGVFVRGPNPSSVYNQAKVKTLFK